MPLTSIEKAASSALTMRIGDYPSKAKRRSGILQPPTSLIERLGYVRRNSITSPPFSTFTKLGTKNRSFLTAVTQGDLPTVKRLLEYCATNRDHADTVKNCEHQLLGDVNINCTDALGRSPLRIAVENENLEIVELLLQYDQLDVGDALLHAIQNDSIGSVILLLNHGSKKKNLQTVFGALPSSAFTPDMTPLILASIKDNYAIVHLLLDNGFTIPQPHDIRCRCDKCNSRGSSYNSLGLSRSRLNMYSALASPSLICLTSRDPLLTTFELSSQLSALAQLEVEYRSDYYQLATQCRQFAVSLLDQVRDTNELSIVLNYEPELHYFEERQRAVTWKQSAGNEDSVPCLARFKLAIKYKQKQFIAHPSCQQFLASIWYSAIPGFRQMSFIARLTVLVGIGLSSPVLCVTNIFLPKSKVGRLISQPFVKFVCHSASYLFFIILLMLASQRFDIGTLKVDNRSAFRGPMPTATEWILCLFVIGSVWADAKVIWKLGLREYLGNRWNLFTFAINNLFVCVIFLRAVTIFTRCQHGLYATLPRREWHSSDPNLVHECIFAIAAVFACLKLLSIFTVSAKIGPLQIAFGRMLLDIAQFGISYSVLLLAFSCGLSQVYWFYANNRHYAVKPTDTNSICTTVGNENSWLWNSTGAETFSEEKTTSNRFLNVFEILQSLYWGLFSLIDLEALDLMGKHDFTAFIGRLLFGSYTFMGVIVLVNALIAMMTDSYKKIQRQADVEWKFALAHLWLTYFEDVYDLPIPFNLMPSVFSIRKFLHGAADFYRFIVETYYEKFRSSSLESAFTEKDDDIFIEEIIRRSQNRTSRYQEVIRELAKRYLIKRQENLAFSGVTEDDLAEIKQEITGFKYELLEVLRHNEMKIPEYIRHGSVTASLYGTKDTAFSATSSRRISDPIADQCTCCSRSSTRTAQTMLSRHHSLPVAFGSFTYQADNAQISTIMLDEERQRQSYNKCSKQFREMGMEDNLFRSGETHTNDGVRHAHSNNDIFTISETADF